MVRPMEHTFGAGTMIQDAIAPHRYSRRGPARRRPRAWAAAAGVAVAGVFLLGGVAYGGASSGPQSVVVHSGDTLWAIAGSHYPGDDLQERVAQIKAANHLHSAALSPGEILVLPAP